MAMNLRSYVRGDARPIATKAVASATVIEHGDIVGQDSDGKPYAAADETWDTSLAVTQETFHTKFLGVAGARSRSGDTDPIVVRTGGVYRFQCASGSWKLGALVGPAKASGNALLSNKVVSVAGSYLAIGRIARDYPDAVTEVEVEICSTKMDGGEHAVTQSVPPGTSAPTIP